MAGYNIRVMYWGQNDRLKKFYNEQMNDMLSDSDAKIHYRWAPRPILGNMFARFEVTDESSDSLKELAKYMYGKDVAYPAQIRSLKVPIRLYVANTKPELQGVHTFPETLPITLNATVATIHISDNNEHLITTADDTNIGLNLGPDARIGGYRKRTHRHCSRSTQRHRRRSTQRHRRTKRSHL